MESTFVILAAEDDEIDRKLLQETLKDRNDCSLYFVHNGVEALDYLYRRGKHHVAENSPRPNLLLLDLNMPKMGGREALKEIRNDAQFNNVPIVIFTTSDAEYDKDSSFSHGSTFYITKPVGLDAYKGTLTNLVDAWISQT